MRAAVSVLAALIGLAAPACEGRGPADRAAGRPTEGAERAASSSPAEGAGLSLAEYDRWRQPERVVAALDLRPGQVVADIGAGSGYFTPRLAEAVGPSGRVVATDIDARAIAALSALARGAVAAVGAAPGAAPRRAPIEVRQVTPDDPGLEPGRYDRILVAQVDHFLRDRTDYLRRLRAALAPGGRVAIVNRIHHRAGLDAAAAAAGYSIAAEVRDLPGQFLLLLSADPPPGTPP